MFKRILLTISLILGLAANASALTLSQSVLTGNGAAPGTLGTNAPIGDLVLVQVFQSVTTTCSAAGLGVTGCGATWVNGGCTSGSEIIANFAVIVGTACNTVSITNGVSGQSVHIMDFTGTELPSSIVIDGTMTDGQAYSIGPIEPSPYTSTNATDLIIGGVMSTGGVGGLPGSPWNNLGSAPPYTTYQIVSSVGTFQPSWGTLSSVAYWGASVLGIELGSIGPTPTPTATPTPSLSGSLVY
jgi:hypothetical protein